MLPHVTCHIESKNGCGDWLREKNIEIVIFFYIWIKKIIKCRNNLTGEVSVDTLKVFRTDSQPYYVWTIKREQQFKLPLYSTNP